MQPFVNGLPFIERFASSAGEIEVLAEVEFVGSTLRLSELAVAPVGMEPTRPGASILRGIVEQIVGAATAQGFETVEFEGVRETGSRIGRLGFAVGRTRERT